MGFKFYIPQGDIKANLPIKEKPSQSDNPFEYGYKHIRDGYYPPEFYKIRFEVIKRFQDRCFLCGELANEIHHIDYNKMNNSLDNLMLLCRNCHGKTNFNRESCEIVLKEKMKNYFLNYNEKEEN